MRRAFMEWKWHEMPWAFWMNNISKACHTSWKENISPFIPACWVGSGYSVVPTHLYTQENKAAHISKWTFMHAWNRAPDRETLDQFYMVKVELYVLLTMTTGLYYLYEVYYDRSARHIIIFYRISTHFRSCGTSPTHQNAMDGPFHALVGIKNDTMREQL